MPKYKNNLNSVAKILLSNLEKWKCSHYVSNNSDYLLNLKKVDSSLNWSSVCCLVFIGLIIFFKIPYRNLLITELIRHKCGLNSFNKMILTLHFIKLFFTFLIYLKTHTPPVHFLRLTYKVIIEKLKYKIRSFVLLTRYSSLSLKNQF